MIYYATFKVVMFKTPPKGDIHHKPCQFMQGDFYLSFCVMPLFSDVFFPQEYHSISGRFVFFPILKVFFSRIEPFSYENYESNECLSPRKGEHRL